LTQTKSILLRALKLNGPMTAIQMSKLVPLNRKGEAAVYQPNQNRRIFLLRSYMTVHKMLKSHEGKQGFWKVLKTRNNDADIWIDIDLRKRQIKQNESESRIANLAHELAVGDVYCALFPHRYSDQKPILEYWDRDRGNDVHQAVRYDARLRLFGKEMFLEVERGNHPILSPEQAEKAGKSYYEDSLNYKIDRYLKHFKDSGYQPFTVLFTIEDWRTGTYDREGTEELFEKYAALLARFTSHHTEKITFLLARQRDVVGDRDHTPTEIHNEVLGDPLGQVWYDPAQNAYVSLLDPAYSETHSPISL
jgi:hypothetical protein